MSAPGLNTKNRWMEPSGVQTVSGRVTQSGVLRVNQNGIARVAWKDSRVITLTSPRAYQVFQRSGSTGTIVISGTVSGGGDIGVEVSVGGSVWSNATVDALTGEFTASVSAAAGQTTVYARAVGHPGSVVAVAYVGVGDVFAIWGQSNGSGRGTNNQAYSHATLKAGLYGNDGTWKNLVDPSDSGTNQVDTVSLDADTQMGSPWPLAATQLMVALGYPVAFIPCCKGATGFSGAINWTPSVTNPLDRTTLFGSAVSRINDAGGCKAILWWQGEGGFDDVTGNSYVNPFKVMAAELAVQLPGVPIIPCKLQYCVGISDARQANGWLAIERIWSEVSNALEGPTLADDPEPIGGNVETEDEGQGLPYFHLKSDAALLECATRWSDKLIEYFA